MEFINEDNGLLWVLIIALGTPLVAGVIIGVICIMSVLIDYIKFWSEEHFKNTKGDE